MNITRTNIQGSGNNSVTAGEAAPVPDTTPQLVFTSDGSHTLYNRELDQHYHSTFGAVQESEHIYIQAGLKKAIEKFQAETAGTTGFLNILEIGFGTGLNALLTLAESEKLGIRVHYTALEAFPVEEDCWMKLNYPHLLGSPDHSKVFARLHHADWEIDENISTYFMLRKVRARLETYVPDKLYRLVYFDAFGPDAQPELWTVQVFQNLSRAIVPGGLLVTYSVKGIVVRALRSSGFLVEKIAGPPGKRHILRAVKP